MNFRGSEGILFEMKSDSWSLCTTITKMLSFYCALNSWVCNSFPSVTNLTLKHLQVNCAERAVRKLSFKTQMKIEFLGLFYTVL